MLVVGGFALAIFAIMDAIKAHRAAGRKAALKKFLQDEDTAELHASPPFEKGVFSFPPGASVPGLIGIPPSRRATVREDWDLRRPVVESPGDRIVLIPRRVGQVQVNLDCEDCGRTLTVIILIDRPKDQPLVVWNGVVCPCGASQTLEIRSEGGGDGHAVE